MTRQFFPLPPVDRLTLVKSDPSLQQTTKTLGPRVRTVDIYQRDLLPLATGNGGNDASNIAGVKFPVPIWLEGLLTGKGQGWKEIVVVSERIGRAGVAPVV